MNIAFYAPLKSPHHPNPSGDRQIARLLIRALQHAGHRVSLVSELRTLEKQGDLSAQQRLCRIGKYLADRLLRRWQHTQQTPDLWFTYHLYYKAPDLIGPHICRALNIPYLIAEASWSEKRATGEWACFHQQVEAALARADGIYTLNPVDRLELSRFYQRTRPEMLQRMYDLPAFIDPPAVTSLSRQAIAARFQLDPALPWLITVAMMRPGDKMESYTLLSRVLQQSHARFNLLVVGDGVCGAEVRSLLGSDPRVRFAGKLDNPELFRMFNEFSVNLWPAVNEAIGLNFVEAQSQGVAIIAGRERGVHSVVADGQSGILTPPGDTAAMALALDQLLADPQRLQRYRRHAADYIQQQHSLNSTTARLNETLGQFGSHR
ncbi:glycosyltransferase family 4 protein [Neptuniibacter halophilus]|uniref:glycosyltransferase family 4 protein n=1 Tax=Neptuniibacter halophilus TaxID=651666 RepID=UPI0025729601|nr:glycosyltransferase family 4 protein [Neptuniibacter halophilus]